MQKFRKKPVVIEAHQWFKNGDHPEDHSKMIEPNRYSITQLELFLSEGRIVRFFRRPDIQGDSACKQCGKIYNGHGWIDTIEGGHIVCPGDWIITGVNGEYYPCKPDIFEKTYESASVMTLSASEALYGFAGWLTSRDEKATFSSKDNAAIAAELVDAFCKANNLELPRERFNEWLNHPEA